MLSYSFFPTQSMRLPLPNEKNFKMNDNLYKNFVADLIYEIQNKDNIFEKDTDLYKGYNFALYDILSLIKMQSEAFGINAQEISLNQINLEAKYLLDKDKA